MTKTQTIFGMFVLLILLVSADLFFGNPILETFTVKKHLKM